MNDFTEDPTPVTRHLVLEDQRIAVADGLFGVHFQLQLEPVIYGNAERMAEAYRGGYWIFYTLDNGGFYMAPEGDLLYQVSCDNYFTGELSADALGVSACLFAYSHCSFSRDKDFSRLCARQYHLLREYMYEHAEVGSILRTID